MKYFTNCKTLEELKTEYRKLAMANHPDRGGSVEAMQAINEEYSRMFELLKNTHATKDGKTYTAKTETTEAPTDFIELINELLKMDGICIECIGCFVWVSGDTKPHKEQLKALGFRWSKNKSMWYKAPTDYHKTSHKTYTMDEIRNTFGVQYETRTERKLQLAY